MCITFFCSRPDAHCVTLLQKPESVKPWGLGQSPSVAPKDQLNEKLKLYNIDSVFRGQAPLDSVQLAVAFFFITQIFASFRQRVLAGKHGEVFRFVLVLFRW